jgi:hypothetical protein
MKLEYRIQRGHYNFCNPQEWQTIIFLKLNDLSLSLSLDADDYDYYKNEFDESPIDAAIEAMEKYQKRTLWSSTLEKLPEFKKQLEQNEDEIMIDFLENKLKIISGQQAALLMKRGKIQSRLDSWIKNSKKEHDSDKERESVRDAYNSNREDG